MQKKAGVVCIKRKNLLVLFFVILVLAACLVWYLVEGHCLEDVTETSQMNNDKETVEKIVGNGSDKMVSKTIVKISELENNAETKSVEKSTIQAEAETTKKEYIRWVEFKVTKEALQQAYEYDVNTHKTENPLKISEILSYLGAKYGGDFARYDPKDMSELAEKLTSGKETLKNLTKDMKYYPYYRQAYGAVLDGMVGEYQISENGKWVTKYGLKEFHPIAKGFPYSDYDDFGVSRSYGYKRNHLGHDMMGQVGTPVVAVESGYVAELGWNQYGGWRIGINSFDKKRYYYYAHLRQDFPYAKWLKKGSVVQAGDVIGYMGRTGYSASENVNNIDTYHLHFGLQLIFDEVQREGVNQIWVDVYPLIRFLHQNQTDTVRDDATKERSRIVQYKDPEAEKYKKAQKKSKKTDSH